MSYQRASIEERKCPMYDDTCAARVAEHIATFYGPGFDAMALIEKQCGRFTRGKYPNKLRGWATISYVAVGGWRKNGPGEGNGRVLYPGTVLGVSITDFNGKVYLAVGN